MRNALNWFEIVASDFERAIRFYESIFGLAGGSMMRMEMDGGKMAAFPSDRDAVGGAIWHKPGDQPGPGGTRVYLNCAGQLDAVLARVAQAGGKIVAPKFPIGPWGFCAMIIDTEGNLVGLHEAPTQ